MAGPKKGAGRDKKKAPLGWFGGKWFLVRDYCVLDAPSEAAKAFVAGGAAGALSKTVVAPVERVKLLTQLEGCNAAGAPRSIAAIAKDVWRLEGWRGFWRGNGPTVLRVVPNKGILFMCNDYYVSLLTFDGDISMAGRFIAGSMSGATSVTFTYPLEMLQARLGSSSRYAGIRDCLQRTWGGEGPRAFYRGYTASLLGIIPYTGSQFFLYEGGKRLLRRFHAKRNRCEEVPLPVWEKFLVGAASGKCAQACSYPMDTVRRRLQVGSAVAFHGPWDCCKSIWRSEGLLGFYRGMSLNAFRAMPSQGVQFAAYEVFKDLFGIRIERPVH